MKKLSPVLVILVLTFLCFNSFAQRAMEINPPVTEQSLLYVVPPEYTGVVGPNIFNGPLTSTARTYQMLINESLLTNFVGKEIKGLTWRLGPAASANWPASDQTFANYDVYMSGSVAPADRSLTFANNVVGTQTQVRSGSLVIPAGSFRFGTSPNDFGHLITFGTPYLYNGGHLLIEIRHSGTSGLTTSNDAIGTTTPGYGTLVSACWTGSYAGVSGTQGNFSITQLYIDDVIPVELTSFSANVLNNNVELTWVTASETNNLGFEIERRLETSEFEKIGFVNGAGSTSETQSYKFSDVKLSSGKYYYRLKQIDFDGTSDYSNEIAVDIANPNVYSLEQNYPNPFNPVTTIQYNLPTEGHVSLKIYDLIGNEVTTLVNEVQTAGVFSISFNAINLSSGVYFYTLKTEDYTATKKLVLMK